MESELRHDRKKKKKRKKNGGLWRERERAVYEKNHFARGTKIIFPLFVCSISRRGLEGSNRAGAPCKKRVFFFGIGTNTHTHIRTSCWLVCSTHSPVELDSLASSQHATRSFVSTCVTNNGCDILCAIRAAERVGNKYVPLGKEIRPRCFFP